ncbi:hypothetical protein ScPMuIL_008267, partial [Solemya velum]
SVMQFASRNGRPGIFWQQDLAKKSDRKFGYKKREQRFLVRKHPGNLDRYPVEDANILGGKINSERNREKVTSKPQEQKEPEKTVTLTQDQLNAILASVGKVASGKESALRISIDSGNNGIIIESPRKGDESSDEESEVEEKADKEKPEKDQYSREEPLERREKKGGRKVAEEASIYNFFEDSGTTSGERNILGQREKTKKTRGHRNKEDSDEEEPVREWRKHKTESRERDSSKERGKSRLNSREKENRKTLPDSREKDSQYDRKQRKHQEGKHKSRRKKEEESDNERTPERKKKSSKRHWRKVESPTPERSKSPPLERRAKSPTTPENKEERTPERKQLTPRDIVGIPAALPWKHMTVAERRRLMIARTKIADAEKKERESRLEIAVPHSRQAIREASPELQRNTEANSFTENRVSPQGLPPVAPSHMSLAEKKRMQWDKERSESGLEKDFTPWGRPGAGAPVRTRSGHVLADYRSRQDYILKTSMEIITEDSKGQSSGGSPSKTANEHTEKSQKTRVEPSTSHNQHASMRSSFLIGQPAPDPGWNKSTAEEEKRSWLRELDRQRDENQMRKIREAQDSAYTENTWAEKLGTDYKYRALPEQTVSGHELSQHAGTDSGRISSAPTKPTDTADEPESFIRGQNAYIDPAVKKDLEEKRQRHLEHQSAIMAQVQEKQRLKQLELDRKRKEEAEEEKRLQHERDMLQNQFQIEQQKQKLKEQQRQNQIDTLKMAMDDAHEKAMQEKMIRRLEHLQQGGHDTSQLRANLEAKLPTPRNPMTAANVEPLVVPGLDLDTTARHAGQTSNYRPQYTHTDRHTDLLQQYTENRVLTPSQYRHQPQSSQNQYNPYIHDFSTQTGKQFCPCDTNPQPAVQITWNLTEKNCIRMICYYRMVVGKEVSDVGILYKDTRRVRVKSAQPVHEPATSNIRKKRRVHGWEKRSVDYQNPSHKRPGNSQRKKIHFLRDGRMIQKNTERKQTPAMVEANKDRIPTDRRTPSHSRDPSPISDRGRNTRRTNTGRRSKSHSPGGLDNYTHQTGEQTFKQKTPHSSRNKSPAEHRHLSPILSSRAKVPKSPVVPALRHKLNDANTDGYRHGEQLEDYGGDRPRAKGRGIKYGDGGPIDPPIAEGDFIPFLRSAETLDPGHAEDPMPLSREASAVTKARMSYLHGLEPSNFGGKVDIYEDAERLPIGKRNNRSTEDLIIASISL